MYSAFRQPLLLHKLPAPEPVAGLHTNPAAERERTRLEYARHLHHALEFWGATRGRAKHDHVNLLRGKPWREASGGGCLCRGRTQPVSVWHNRHYEFWQCSPLGKLRELQL